VVHVILAIAARAAPIAAKMLFIVVSPRAGMAHRQATIRAGKEEAI
jgi:hypothetical protein